MGEENRRDPEDPILLVAVDFSYCSRLALRKAKELKALRDSRMAVLHVIDHAFVEQCNRYRVGNEKEIKKKLFMGAKSKLRDLIHREGLEDGTVTLMVCEGTPCIEINKKATKIDADMVIIGSRGKSGDMKSIFFGSTAERVLRFITKPVLCVPPQADYQLGQ
ncbi:MAG: universal stress protein [Deltaproteobacteria bacterium]|jgi:nucleotide-binding universal stress UspA family protein|nr:universal stress protein [Deltaproteobacteria bacterium]